MRKKKDTGVWDTETERDYIMIWNQIIIACGSKDEEAGYNADHKLRMFIKKLLSAKEEELRKDLNKLVEDQFNNGVEHYRKILRSLLETIDADYLTNLSKDKQ